MGSLASARALALLRCLACWQHIRTIMVSEGRQAVCAERVLIPAWLLDFLHVCSAKEVAGMGQIRCTVLRIPNA